MPLSRLALCSQALGTSTELCVPLGKHEETRVPPCDRQKHPVPTCCIGDVLRPRPLRAWTILYTFQSLATVFQAYCSYAPHLGANRRALRARKALDLQSPGEE